MEKIDKIYLIELIKKLSQDPEINKDSIYEYCIKEKSLKILNLFFYKDLEENEKQRLYQKRKRQIKEIFKFLSEKGFDLTILNRLLDEIDEPDYPLQIAFEFSEKGIEKAKIYFSNINRLKNNLKDSLRLIKKIMDILEIPDKIKNNQILGEGIDTLGIDFFKNKKTELKLYSFYHKKYSLELIRKTIINEFKKYNIHTSRLDEFFKRISSLDFEDWGFLYRISSDCNIDRLKTWFHLRPDKNKKYKLHYLCSNGEDIEEYFRS